MQFTSRITSFLCISLIAISVCNAQSISLYFGVDDATLTPASIKNIDEQMSKLKAAPGLRVIGYADADGVNDDNDVLSDARAAAITNYLTTKGISSDVIVAFGNGETMAKQNNASAYDKQLDRRVDIEVLNTTELALAKKLSTFKTPDRFKVTPIIITFDPTKPNDIPIGTRGTILHIPANSFVDASGKNVTSTVTISFSEYTTSGEMVFSGIPMHYKTGTDNQRFSSSGMFKIEGTAAGATIEMAPNASVTMDYAMVGNQNDVGFYTLDEKGEWQLINNIGVDGKPIATNTSSKTGNKTQETKQVKADSATAMQFANAFNNNLSTVKTERITGSTTRASVKASLTLSGFGYYNCDALAPMVARVNIGGNFLDDQGKPILRINNITVVDLKFNGAFYYNNPANIQLDSRSDNMIFVSNQANRIFYVSNADMKAMKISKSGNYDIKMKEITKTHTNNDQLTALIQSNKMSK